MLDLVREAIGDTLPMIPVLWGLYLGLELLGRRQDRWLSPLAARTGGIGPVVGAALGIIPQCGISVFMTSLYLGGRVSRGTLVATYLATSDEALPVLIAHGGQGGLVVRIVIIKMVLGGLAGLVVDAVAGPRHRYLRSAGGRRGIPVTSEPAPHNEGWIAAARHALTRSLTIFAWVLAVTIAMGLALRGLGGEAVLAALRARPVLEVAGAALFGLIPNCAASIALAEAAVRGVLPFGATVAGLSAGAGYGPILLVKDGPAGEAVRLLCLCLVISIAAGLGIMALGAG